jgi:hypothetical protein
VIHPTYLAEAAVSHHQHLDKLAAPDFGGLWTHGAKHGQLAAAGSNKLGKNALCKKGAASDVPMTCAGQV